MNERQCASCTNLDSHDSDNGIEIAAMEAQHAIAAACHDRELPSYIAIDYRPKEAVCVEICVEAYKVVRYWPEMDGW